MLECFTGIESFQVYIQRIQATFELEIRLCYHLGIVSDLGLDCDLVFAQIETVSIKQCKQYLRQNN